jgi:AraC family transcriptional regulator
LDLHSDPSDLARRLDPRVPGVQLVRAVAGERSAFAAGVRRFAPGFVVPPNHRPGARLAFQVSGTHWGRFDRFERETRVGQTAYRPPDTVASGRFCDAGSVDFVLDFPADIRGLSPDPSVHPGLHPLMPDALCELLENDASTGLSIDCVGSQATDILRCARVVHEGRPPWLPRVVECLRAQPLVAPSLSELADVADVHPAHLSRTFQRVVGCSPGQYHRRVRLAEAARRLADGDTLLPDIAAELGFADQSHFGRHFKRVYRISPARYRSRFRRAQRAVGR